MRLGKEDASCFSLQACSRSPRAPWAERTQAQAGRGGGGGAVRSLGGAAVSERQEAKEMLMKCIFGDEGTPSII